MFALVYKNKVIASPKDWNRAFFTFALNRVGIKNALLPKTAPDSNELPLVIDEDTKIYSVVESRDYNINPMIQHYRGPLWTIGESEVTATYEIIDTEIQFARDNFRKLAAEERYKKEVTGIKVEIQGQQLSITTQRIERDQFAQKDMAIGASDTVNWKFNEVWVELTKSDIQTIVSAIETHVQSTFDWEKSIDDLISAANTAEELLAITIVEPLVDPVE